MSPSNDAHIPDWNEVRASLAKAARDIAKEVEAKVHYVVAT